MIGDTRCRIIEESTCIGDTRCRIIEESPCWGHPAVYVEVVYASSVSLYAGVLRSLVSYV